MLHATRKTFHRWVPDQSGTVAIIFTLALVPVVAAAGGAIDYARTLAARSDMQQAADAAALAGVGLTNVPDAKRIAVAETVFYTNYDSNRHGAATPSVTVDGSKVSVTASVGVKTSFLGIIGIEEYPVTASSRATTKEGHGDYVCMLALNPTMSGGLTFRGSRELSGLDCAVRANSDASSAVVGIGGGYVANAKSFCAAGGGQNAGGLSPALETCDPMDDPYAKVVPPSVGGCTYTNLTLTPGPHTLNPGVYCGGILVQANANVTMTSGIYVIKDGTFTVRGLATVTGHRVALHLTGANTKLELLGGSNVEIKAPKSGDLAGFAIYQDADSNPGSTSVINGSGSITLEGVLYQPTHKILVEGNGDINTGSKMWAMVADNFEVSGAGLFMIAPDNNGADLPDITPVVITPSSLTN